MFCKLSVALLLIAAPAVAQDAQPGERPEGAETTAPAKPLAYKTKRICRSIEVVGSSIPRTTCTTKKIPIKPAEEDADAGNKDGQDQQSQL